MFHSVTAYSNGNTQTQFDVREKYSTKQCEQSM